MLIVQGQYQVRSVDSTRSGVFGVNVLACITDLCLQCHKQHSPRCSEKLTRITNKRQLQTKTGLRRRKGAGKTERKRRRNRRRRRRRERRRKRRERERENTNILLS